MSCRPGWIEFTVTPSPAISRASVLRKPVTPARAVFERIRSGMGWRTAIEVIAITRPQRAACIAGTTPWHMATTDKQVELDGAPVGVDVGAGEAPGRRAAGVGDEDVDPTQLACGLFDERRRALGRAHVGDDRAPDHREATAPRPRYEPDPVRRSPPVHPRRPAPGRWPVPGRRKHRPRRRAYRSTRGPRPGTLPDRSWPPARRVFSTIRPWNGCS